MLGLIDTVAKRLVRRGLQRGLRGGDGRYLALGALGLLLHLLARREPARIVREDLRLGEALVVTHLPPPRSRAQRRRSARVQEVDAALAGAERRRAEGLAAGREALEDARQAARGRSRGR